MKKTLLIVASVPVAFLVYFLVTILMGLLVAFVGSIPLIGSMLDYNLDLEWVIRVSNPIFGIICGANVAERLCGNKKPASAFFVLWYIAALLGMFLGDFDRVNLVAYILAIVVAGYHFASE